MASPDRPKPDLKAGESQVPNEGGRQEHTGRCGVAEKEDAAPNWAIIWMAMPSPGKRDTVRDATRDWGQ